MAITLDDVRASYSAYNPDYAAEAASSVPSREQQEAQWDKKWGLPPVGKPSMVPMEAGLTSPTQQQQTQLPVAERKITIKESAAQNAPTAPTGRMQLPELPLQPEKPAAGLLQPTGNVPQDLGKGFTAGALQAVAGEVDTLDWTINKIADVIPGLPRQEVLGRLRNALTPADLEKDTETLTYTIGNALGYGGMQMVLLGAMIFKPLKAAKLLQATKIKDAAKLATRAGRASIREAELATKAAEALRPGMVPGMAGRYAEAAGTGEAWLKGIKAGKFGSRPGVASRVLDTVGNVGLAGPVGLGLHGGITGAKNAERAAEVEAKQQGRDLTALEQLKADTQGFLQGGTSGFMMGTTLGLMHNLSQIQRAAGMGTVFGGMSMAEGADVKRGFADFITGALMGYMPNKPGEKWPFFGGEEKGNKIAPLDSAKKEVNTTVLEDLVGIAQEANVNPTLLKEWANNQGLTPQEAKERFKQVMEFYHGADPTVTRPYMDPNLGVVFKKNGVEPETMVWKQWKKIKGKYKNPVEAAMALEQWTHETFIPGLNFEMNRELMGGINNLLWFVTKDANGYSPVGSQYKTPANAFSGTHTTNWAGSIWREVFKGIKNRSSNQWRATLADGREVDLAESMGNRLSKDANTVVTNEGIEIPVGNVKAITDVNEGKVILMQPEKTAKDMRQEKTVAKRAAAALKKENAKRRKEGLPPIDERGRLTPIVKGTKELAKEATARFEAFQELDPTTKKQVVENVMAANIEDFVGWADELAAQGNVDQFKVYKEGEKVPEKPTAKEGPVPQNWPVIAEFVDQYKKGQLSQAQAAEKIVNVLTPDEMNVALARFSGIPAEVLQEQQRVASLGGKKTPPPTGRGTSAQELMGKVKKQAGVGAVEVPEENFATREEFIESINRRTTPEQRDIASFRLGTELTEHLYAEYRRMKEMEARKDTMAGDWVEERLATGERIAAGEKEKIARERKGTDFKPYEATEPKSPEIPVKPKVPGKEQGPNLVATAKALGISIKELKQMMDEAGLPPDRPVDPAHVPYVLEKLYGFTPTQAKLIAADPAIADMIFDGPGMSPRLLKIRAEIAETERDAALSDYERAVKLEKLRAREEKIPEHERAPFTSQDIYIDDLGRIKPISKRAADYFNTLFDSLAKEIPDLEWPTVSWLGRVMGKNQDRARQIVDSFTLNDLVHALRMDTQFTKMKYHQDLTSNSGISDLPVNERYMWKVAKLFSTHKFHNTIFGSDEAIKRQLQSIAYQNNMRLSDKQLDVAKTWIKMQNEARGINPETGVERAVEDARQAFSRESVGQQIYDPKTGKTKTVKPITLSDVEYYFREDQSKVWDEAAQHAKTISTILRQPITEKQNIDNLRQIVKERLDEVESFGLRFGNLQERVKWANKVTKYSYEIDAVEKSTRKNAARKKADIKKIEAKIAKVTEQHLDPLRRFSFQEDYNKLETRYKEEIQKINESRMNDRNKRIARETAQAKYDANVKRLDQTKRSLARDMELKWGPLRDMKVKDEKGVWKQGGEVASLRNLAAQLDAAYKALKKVEYDAVPQTWKAGEVRRLGIVAGGTGTEPSVQHLQAAAMANVVRHAAKQGGVSSVLAGLPVDPETGQARVWVVKPGEGAPQTEELTRELTTYRKGLNKYLDLVTTKGLTINSKPVRALEKALFAQKAKIEAMPDASGLDLFGKPTQTAEGLKMYEEASVTSAYSLQAARGRNPIDILADKQLMREIVDKQNLSVEQKRRLLELAEEMSKEETLRKEKEAALREEEHKQLLQDEAVLAEQLGGNQWKASIEAQRSEQGGWSGWETDPDIIRANELERQFGAGETKAPEEALGISGKGVPYQILKEGQLLSPKQKSLVKEADAILASDPDLQKAIKEWNMMLNQEQIADSYDAMPSGKRLRAPGGKHQVKFESELSMSPITETVKPAKVLAIRDKRDLKNIKEVADKLSKKEGRKIGTLEVISKKLKIPLEDLQRMNNLPSTTKNVFVGQRVKYREATDDVVSNKFKLMLTQEGMTAAEKSQADLRLKVYKNEAKVADKETHFYPLEEALQKWPWLEREEFQRGSPKLRYHRRDGKKVYYKYKGKTEEGLPVELVEAFPDQYPIREYEKGYFVSDRQVLQREIRSLSARLAGTRLVETKGKRPVVLGGFLEFEEVSQGKDRPPKLVGRMRWERPSEEYIKPGDPVEVRLLRSAEYMVRDYMKEYAPKTKTGDGYLVEYDFKETGIPTVSDVIRKEWESKTDREEYKKRYGRDFDRNAPPPTTKLVTNMWDKKAVAQELPMYRSERLAERRLWMKIAEQERVAKVAKAIGEITSPLERAIYRMSGIRYEYPERRDTSVLSRPEATTERPRELSKKAAEYLKEHPNAKLVPTRRGEVRQKVITGTGAVEQDIFSPTDIWTSSEGTPGGVEGRSGQQTRFKQEAFEKTGVFGTPTVSTTEVKSEVIPQEEGKARRTHTDKRILDAADKAKREALETPYEVRFTDNPEQAVSKFRTNFYSDAKAHGVPEYLWDALVEYHRMKPILDRDGRPVLPEGEMFDPAMSRKQQRDVFSKQNATMSQMEIIANRLQELVNTFEQDKEFLRTATPEEKAASQTLFVSTMSDLRNLMEMIKNKKMTKGPGAEGGEFSYPANVGPAGTPSKQADGGWTEISPTTPRENMARERGVEGFVADDAKSWLKAFEDTKAKFEKNMEDQMFAFRDGRLVDLISASAFPAKNIKYLDSLRELPLDPEQYVLTGSVPVSIRGIRENKDIDVLVSPETFEQLSLLKEVQTRPDSKSRYIKWNDQIEIYAEQPGVDFEMAKARADKVDGMNVMNIEDAKTAKKALGREKDLADVQALEEFQRSKLAKPDRDLPAGKPEDLLAGTPEGGEGPGGAREYRKGGVSVEEERRALPKSTEEAIEMGKGMTLPEARRLAREANAVDKELAAIRDKEDLSTQEMQKLSDASIENQFRHEAIDSFLTKGSAEALTPQERSRRLGMVGEVESRGPATNIGEFSGVGGLPGEHRFLKKPSQIQAQVREVQHIATVNGKKYIQKGASSKEIEKFLEQGARMSREAQMDPKTRVAETEARFNLAQRNAIERPPVKVPAGETDRVPKKVHVQPLTKDAVLKEIKNSEDAKRVPGYLTEEERISMYHRNPVKSRGILRGAIENMGQFSQSSIPEHRLLAQGADKERMNKNHTIRMLMEDPDSPMKRIRRLAKEIQGAISEDDGLEKTAEWAFYNSPKGIEPTDPAMKEILRIARQELAIPFSEGANMVDLGIDLKYYNMPLIVDMNTTYQRVKGRYKDIPYEKLDTVKGGGTILATTTKKEWEQIQSIFNSKDSWVGKKFMGISEQGILTDFEKDMMRRHVFQFTSALDDFNYLPAEVKAKLRLKDTFNKHLQRRSGPDEKDFLSYKHNFADAWENYIFNMVHTNYINNVKQLAAPLLNVYADRDVPLSPGWQMEKYLKGLFGGWDPVEKYIGSSISKLNDTVGREVLNPAMIAKGLPAAITGRTVKGAIGMVDSTIRQLADHTKMMVMDESLGKTYLKTWWEVAKNFIANPTMKGSYLGEYYKAWDALGMGQEAFEHVRTERTIGERLAKATSIPKKIYTLYDWIGTKALGPFQAVENFNKGFGLIFNVNRMKAKGANWNEAVQLGIKSVLGNEHLQSVPKPIYDAYNETLNQTIGYTKEHRNLLMRANPLTRISTIFWSYPGDMARFLYQGTADGWYMGRQYGEWGQFARFAGYIGFQLSIAQAVGATLGLDVGSVFGVGMLPVKVMSLPWEILYNTYKGLDPAQFIGKPQYQEEERQKALDGLLNALGIFFIPQYRWGKQQIKNLQALDTGFKTAPNGRDIMEWSVPRAILTFLGAPPIENSETYNLLTTLDELTTKQGAQRRALLEEGTKALADRNYLKLMEIRKKADAKGIPITMSDIYDEAKDKEELTVLEAGYKKAPKNIKEQFKTQIEELKGRAFPGGEAARRIRKQRNLWSNVDREAENNDEE